MGIDAFVSLLLLYLGHTFVYAAKSPHSTMGRKEQKRVVPSPLGEISDTFGHLPYLLISITRRWIMEFMGQFWRERESTPISHFLFRQGQNRKRDVIFLVVEFLRMQVLGKTLSRSFMIIQVCTNCSFLSFPSSSIASNFFGTELQDLNYLFSLHFVYLLPPPPKTHVE